MPKPSPMKIEKIAYGSWRDAYRCSCAGMELVVVADIGPRILSFRMTGGANILYEAPDGKGLAIGDWRLYGGHRFAVAPETAETYFPDNEPCRVDISDRHIRVTASAAPNGLEKSVEVRPAEGKPAFEIVHRLRNTGAVPAMGAPWAITVVKPAGRVIVPWGSGTDQWRMCMVRYWSRTQGYVAPVGGPQWKPMNDVFLVEPNGSTGKIGLYTDRGWLALLGKDFTFLKRFSPVVSEGLCPDNGCNVELYTCREFLELETLGTFGPIGPGETREHTECWRLVPQTFDENGWREIELL